MKEIWIEESERLEEELEREPTGREIDIAVGDGLGEIADRAKDAWKERDL